MKSGIIIKSTGSRYIVQSDNKNFSCTLRGKFKTKGFRSTNPIAVGDKVDFLIVDSENTGVIEKIHPRRNEIIRRSTNLSRYAHVIAANIDYAFLIVSMRNPKTYPEFIDRFLVSAEYHKIETIIVFNKSDIYTQEDFTELGNLKAIYSGIGYKVEHISVLEKSNTETIVNLIKGKTILISGNSGVGKSSLINFLNPELNLKTSEISAHHLQGTHTTTFAEMHQLSFGGYIIDTPGIRGFGLVHIEKEELYHFFTEIFEAAQGCKFHNCSHNNEPGCMVKQAVEEGRIAWSRYESYLSILLNSNEKYR